MSKQISELEKEFNKCWAEMLTKGYTCKCKDKEGFSIRMKDLHIFGKKFKKNFFLVVGDLITRAKFDRKIELTYEVELKGGEHG